MSCSVCRCLHLFQHPQSYGCGCCLPRHTGRARVCTRMLMWLWLGPRARQCVLLSALGHPCQGYEGLVSHWEQPAPTTIHTWSGSIHWEAFVRFCIISAGMKKHKRSSFCANYAPTRLPRNDTTIRKLLGKVMMLDFFFFFTLISLNVKGRFNWGLNMVSVSTQWCQLGHRTYCTVGKVHVMFCSCSCVALLSQVGLKQQLWCVISSEKWAQRSFVFGGNKKL